MGIMDIASGHDSRDHPSDRRHERFIVTRHDRRKAALRGLISPRAALTSLLFVAFCASCSTDVVTLGKQTKVPFVFDPPVLIAELVAPDGAGSGNATLTGDLLEIYFTSGRNSEQDVWMAQRSVRTDSFSSPTAVADVNSSSFETSSAISQDGLSLWFGSDRDGGLGDMDIWFTTRPDRGSAWSAPRNLMNLNSPSRDIPRSPGQHDLMMPMASDRARPPNYQTMMASRATTAADFGAPAVIPELNAYGGNVDGSLTEDGLYLFLARDEPGNLYVAQRLSLTTPFGPPVPLADLNTAAKESDPWMSPDQTAFYFSSDRDGTLQIYVSAVHPRTP